ncbi:MAG: ExsB family protein [Verrucomicrobiales bacterium]|nr:ExsB family protein [Verrucomicrobiales bacterium]
MGPETQKLTALKKRLLALESCLVAYSGGVDSVFLAYIAHQVLGEKALAVVADSPSLPRRELKEALELGAQFGFPVEVVKTHEFDNQEYLSNPNNRCFFCKHELFLELKPMATAKGFKAIIYGENASDAGDHRPGAMAAASFGVVAPLKEVGLSKAEIRELSRQLGLPTCDKPQMACLSSRIPYGEAVTPEKLLMIENAEYALRDAGFFDVRVRHHELKGGHLARIELGAGEMTRLFDEDIYSELAARICQFGYSHVTLDLKGYRRGSLNEQPLGFKRRAAIV